MLRLAKEGGWRLIGPVLAGVSTIVFLAWLSWGNLRAASALQAELDREYAQLSIERAIRGPLLRNQPRVLRDTVTALVQQPVLGLSFLLVKDLGGVALAVAGDFEQLNVPLPADWTDALRTLLYRLTSDYRQATLMALPTTRGEARPLASIEFAVSRSLLGRVENAALKRLRQAGWAGLVLSALAAVMLAWLLWRQRQMLPKAQALQQRMAPQAPSEPRQMVVAAETLEARLTGQSLHQAAGELETLGFGVIVVQREGKVTWLNALAESLCGWTAEGARDRLVYSVFHPLDDAGTAMPPAAEIVLREARPVSAMPCQLRSRNGLIRPVEMMAAPLRDEAGILTGAVMMFRDASQRHAETQELRRQSRLSQGVIDHLDEGLIMTDPAGVVRFGNARTLRMFGYNRNELEGVTVTKLIPVPFLNTPGIKLADYVASRDRRRLPRVVGWRKDATTFPVELLVQPISVDGDTGYIVVLRDITEKLRGENLATRLGRLLDNAVEEIYIFDAQSLYFLEVNRGARFNLGYRAEQLTRMTPLSVSSGLEAEQFQQYLSDLRGGTSEHLVYRCHHRRADGSEYPVEVRLNFSREEEPPVFMAIAADITSRIESEDRLRALAHQDALTGLPNRTVFLDRLVQARLAADRGHREVAVMFIDIDHFKQINDRHGHAIGDQVLQVLAARLRMAVRSGDTVARLAGDEFVIIAPGMRDRSDAEQLARKLVEQAAVPLDIPGHDLRVTISVGITLYPSDDSDAEGLLHHADAAMYEAKKSGRNDYRLFDARINPERQRTLDLERGVHLAVALNQFHLLFTPVVDASRHTRAGLVSLYWDHPVHGRIDSAEVFRAASRAGLLGDLEAWIVCRSLASFSNAMKGGMTPSSPVVPLSGSQLRDKDFIGQLLHLMDRFEIPPRALILALTPDGQHEAGVASEPIVSRLVQRGIRFALRGFDEGFAALNRESRIPSDFILMAPEYGHDAAPERMERLRRVVQTADALGKQVIVTGVMEARHHEILQQQGVKLFAGPYWSAPLSTRAAGDWMRRDGNSSLL